MNHEGDPTSNRGRKRVLMISTAAVLGALVVLAASFFIPWPWNSDGSNVGGSGTEGGTPAPKPVFTAAAGTCLNWTKPDASDIRQVTCAEPHLFEVTGKDDLHKQFGPQAPYPNKEQWERLKREQCTTVSTNFLSGHFDPHGRFAVGAFTPSKEGWQSGDRTLHCGLQQPGASGELYRIVGSASTLDQADIYPIGTCLGINGTAVADPTDCAKPHAFEITGTVDLGAQFPAGFPSQEDQDKHLLDTCNRQTELYAGGPNVASDKKLTVTWDNVLEESWNAGTKKVNCKVGARLPDRPELAPVTGSVKGDVKIGTEPAPTDQRPKRTGAPAGGVR